MPPRIIQLPDELIARIAAGEVVERPASLVKELVENSLDAGATRISIGIVGAGRTQLSISDNGCGMTLDQARLALKRHCTSKITRLEDLESIETFGFRGEALPSIASVSKLTLTTRVASEDSSWQLVLEGGKLVSEKPVAREAGTTVEVRELFFNTPARFKFMKADSTERGQILRVVEEMAFSAPAVEFEVMSENSKPQVFQRIKPDDLQSRIASAWGGPPRQAGGWEKALVAVKAANPHFKLMGFVTNQDNHQATPRFQFLYVNRRPVLNRRITRAIYNGFMGQLPRMRHPGWVLFLEVDPKTVDVNVHPSKREVKLTHESEIFGFVLNAVKSALSQAPDAQAPMFRIQPSAPGSGWKIGTAQNIPGPEFRKEFGSSQHVGSPRQILSETPAAFIAEFGRPSQTSAEVLLKERVLLDPSLKVVAQVKNTFIVAETDTEFLLIDQHAAAEKAAYEKIMADLKNQTPRIQMMLVPFSWEAAFSLTPTIKASLPILSKMGFVIEPFGGNTFVVKGLPAHLGDKYDLLSLLDGLSDVLTEPENPRTGLPAKNPNSHVWSGGRAGVENNQEHQLAAMTACKASVKAGDRLSLPECERILKDLSECQAPQTCPHGRPTIVRMPYEELLRRFRRS